LQQVAKAARAVVIADHQPERIGLAPGRRAGRARVVRRQSARALEPC
jgi:hypothetical protein